jgi:hypothetical protein
MTVATSAVNMLMATLVSSTVKAQMVDASYVFDAAHDFLADVAGGSRVHTPVTLTGKSVADKWFVATVPPFVAVPAGDTVTGLWLYVDTGSEATSSLLDFKDRRADTVPLSVATTGGNITFTFALDRVFKL